MKIGPNPTWGCVDGVSFHALLLSKIEFRQHLPVVLQIHVLEGRLCIWRTTGRCCQNSITDQSRAWKLTTSTHPWVVQKTWTIWNRYGYRYAKICIFSTIPLSNGRRLSRLRDIQIWYGKRGVGCLTLLSCKVTSRGRCNSLSCKKRNIVVSNLNFGSTSPARGGFQNLQQIQRHDGRQPHPQ